VQTKGTNDFNNIFVSNSMFLLYYIKNASIVFVV
jgi:hypothetical protein